MKIVKPSEAIHRYLHERGFRVRVFDPRGLYPRGIFASESYLYSAYDDLVFTVVRGQPYDQVDSDFPYSEMTWVCPEEVRLWASIILCEDADGPKVILYPEYASIGLLEPSDTDLRDAKNQQRLRHLVRKACIEQRPGLAQYSVFDTEINLYRQPQFFKEIAESNRVLLRAITCLIKCDMLSRHREFTEEATIVAFIALDASFSMVCDLLSQKGVDNPTAEDAGKWLDDTFNRPVGVDPGVRKYFEEIYEQRVLTMHPSSRLGSCPFAPLMVDDLFDLRRDLREVFAYLVSGQHGPEFKRRLAASVCS